MSIINRQPNKAPSGALFKLGYIALIIIGLNTPNHEQPIPSFWIEIITATGILGLALSTRNTPSIRHLPSRTDWLLAIPLIAWAQYAVGLVRLPGDAIIISGYALYAWTLARLIGAQHPSERDTFLVLLFTALLAAWFVGFTLQWIQWLGIKSIWLADTGRSRPAGNLTQPNHFATWTILVACGAMWLHKKKYSNLPIFFLLTCQAISLALSASRTAYIALVACVALAWCQK